MVDGVESHQTYNNEINRDNNVQEPRDDEDEDAGDKGNDRRDMGSGDDHWFSSGLIFAWWRSVTGCGGNMLMGINAQTTIRFYATKGADASPPAAPIL
jgi:hypothetical protein